MTKFVRLEALIESFYSVMHLLFSPDETGDTTIRDASRKSRQHQHKCRCDAEDICLLEFERATHVSVYTCGKHSEGIWASFNCLLRKHLTFQYVIIQRRSESPVARANCSESVFNSECR